MNSVWALDLDGVVWLADDPIPGAATAVATLRAAGIRVLFATNNSSVRVGDVEAKLARHEIPAAGDVVTSAMAGALAVEPGERVLVLGGPGVFEALRGRGVEAIDAASVGPGEPPQVDAVMVGFHREFDYERLRAGAVAVRRGARLIGTNDDATYPTPTGPIPGGGSILAAVAMGAGAVPLVTGKPYQSMATAVVAVAGGPVAWMIGDRPDTDGNFAVTLGARFGLVLSGVTHESDLPVTPVPQKISKNLAQLVVEVLADC